MKKMRNNADEEDKSNAATPDYLFSMITMVVRKICERPSYDNKARYLMFKI